MRQRSLWGRHDIRLQIGLCARHASAQFLQQLQAPDTLGREPLLPELLDLFHRASALAHGEKGVALLQALAHVGDLHAAVAVLGVHDEAEDLHVELLVCTGDEGGEGAAIELLGYFLCVELHALAPEVLLQPLWHPLARLEVARPHRVEEERRQARHCAAPHQDAQLEAVHTDEVSGRGEGLAEDAVFGTDELDVGAHVGSVLADGEGAKDVALIEHQGIHGAVLVRQHEHSIGAFHAHALEVGHVHGVAPEEEHPLVVLPHQRPPLQVRRLRVQHKHAL
mmetsp:Transcript_4119/g.14541  ORF Transcript_4119/g.14541 Transcript_4119/m.14541 type:complete len:280 (-) Transcript_4119:983-1822(-)